MAGEELNQKLSRLFAAEARESIQAIVQSCLKLEKQPGMVERFELTVQILRQTHNLKGAARSLGRIEIATLTHRLETLFEAIKGTDFELETDIFDQVYQALDGIISLATGKLRLITPIERLLDQLDVSVDKIRTSKITMARPLEAESLIPDMVASEETIRLTVGRLEAILNQVNELQVARLSLERSLAQMRHILYDSEHFKPLLHESLPARAQFTELYRHSEASHRHLTQLLSQLQENVHQARMLPLETVFNPLPRISRDLARE